MANPLNELTTLGQSVWLDFIRRKMLHDGGLQRFIDGDSVRGMTANPTIFEKAIGAGDDYDEQIAGLVREGVPPRQLFQRLAVTDLRDATGIMRQVYDATDGSDGFVSIEVSPAKAYQTQATIDEVKQWWSAIDRPNLMVKIPGTDAGIPAIEECLAQGMNINITLLFAVEMHERVIEAYLRALERRVEAQLDIRGLNSVASFFVSRVDTLADRMIEEKIAEARTEGERSKLERLLGKVAVANAKVAYRRFREVFASERFERLAAKGAKLQRPLWASTGTKNPKYSDILYVAELIGPDTVNTMPPETIDAFRDHGVVRRTIDENYAEAEQVLRDLAEVGISLVEITDKLQKDGVEAFAKSFKAIEDTTAQKAHAIRQRVGAT